VDTEDDAEVARAIEKVLDTLVSNGITGFPTTRPAGHGPTRAFLGSGRRAA
jgi:hypothetical protein